MGGPGGRPQGYAPNIGVFFNLNTKLLALLYENRRKPFSFQAALPLTLTRGCLPLDPAGGSAPRPPL